MRYIWRQGASGECPELPVKIDEFPMPGTGIVTVPKTVNLLDSKVIERGF